MMVSEQEFYLLNGNAYRGSRYANFAGSGIDPQGNVSPVSSENAATQTGTATDPTAASGGGTATGALPSGPSAGLIKPPSLARSLGGSVVGAALPYAGQKIGQTAGAALGQGASFGGAINEGISALGNKISPGLLGGSALGAGAATTNAALAARGANFGPATNAELSAAQGSAGTATGASGVGGAVGAGLGTLAAGLISGQKPIEAVKGAVGSAIGTYAGTAIGTAIGGPIGGTIGGFIGGTIGSIFCFSKETEIVMRDGSLKEIGMIGLGEEVLYGGIVTGRGEAYAEEIYEYKGVKVTGTHAVLEDGKWIRVRDSAQATKLDVLGAIIVPMTTMHHILITKTFVSADLHEISPTEEHRVNYEDRLDFLNANESRNLALTDLAKVHCIG